MNISGIRPISGFYSERIKEADQPSANKVERVAPQRLGEVSLSISKEGRSKTFGSYDVLRQHKPSDGFKTTGVDKAFSQKEVAKAVDVMKRDGSLHKYQTFIGATAKEPLIRRSGLENFTL